MSHTANITLEEVSIGFGKKVLIRDINLRLPESGLIALIGPNGSGKSTLLNTILGSKKQLKGSIKLNDQAIASFSSNELAKLISVVYSRLEAVDYFTVKDLISLGRIPYTGMMGKLRDYDEEVIRLAIESCELNHLSSTPCTRLSDGELQKVLIARAIAQDTPILLLDEPTSHLDTLNRIGVLQLLKRISVEQRKLIILSSHDISLCLQTADRIWLLTNNTLISESPERIIQEEAFASSFISDKVSFDKETYSFQIDQ